MIFFLDQVEAQWHQHHQGRATGLLRPRDQMGSARPFLNTGLLWLLAPSGPNVVRTATFPSSGHTSNLGPTGERGAPMPTHTLGPCQALQASPSPAQVSTTLKRGDSPSEERQYTASVPRGPRPAPRLQRRRSHTWPRLQRPELGMRRALGFMAMGSWERLVPAAGASDVREAEECVVGNQALDPSRGAALGLGLCVDTCQIHGGAQTTRKTCLVKTTLSW